MKTMLFKTCHKEIKEMFSGYFVIEKDIFLNDTNNWIGSNQMVLLSDLVISFHRQYERSFFDNYKVEIKCKLFGGENHDLSFIIDEVKDKSTIISQLYKIFRKVHY